MKKILITGANSYIGTSFETYMKQWESEYQIDTIDMIDGSWRESDFSQYYTVFHVAGIVHQKETKKNKELYYKINRDLAIEVATKAKNEGVNQFIFLSSMSVYGMDTGVITKETVPKPMSNYGKSKLEAEIALGKLVCDTFKIAIIRPPMVYGKDCKGNFKSIIKIVEKFPIFPSISNKRSMIYIDNLSCFIHKLIALECMGVFYPQNKENVSTQDIVKISAMELDKKIVFSKAIAFFIIIFKPFSKTIQKAFGDLIYSLDENDLFAYEIVKFKESIIESVTRK